MKQHNPYAAGRKAYGGGRSNPTSGTVNPTGYIDRAANKQASQRRSGLAKMALSRMGPWKSTTPTSSPAAPSPTGENYTAPPNPYADLSSQPAGDTPTTYTAPLVGQNPLARDDSGNVGHATPDQVAAGQWQPPVDPEAEAQAAAYEAERQRFLTDLMGQETNFRSAAGRRLRDLSVQQPIAQEQLLGDFAGRGMAFSGRYLHDTGDLQSRFAQQQTDVNEDLNSNLSQIASARAGKNSEIQALLNKNNATSAARNANNPLFRAPVAPTYNFAPGVGGSEDELAIEAIKRRLAQGA